MNYQILKEQLKDVSNPLETNYNNHLLTIVLYLTGYCNLKCNYCFEQRFPEKMTLAIAEQAINWAIQNKQKATKLKVLFFGGEPLLEFNTIIKPIIEKYQNKLDYSITTNGTLLTEDILLFFQAHNVKLMLSYDGKPQLNNIQRDNSSQKIIQILPKILKIYPKIKIRMTLTKKAIPFLHKSILWLTQHKIQNIMLEPNIYEEWTISDKTLFIAELKKIYADKIQTTIEPFSFYQNKIRKNNFLFPNSCLHCGLGTSMCAIAPNGDIYPCQEYVNNAMYILGDIFNGIDKNKHLSFLQLYQDNLKQMNCNLQCSSDICQKMCLNQICPSKLFNCNFIKNKTMCYYNQALCEFFLGEVD